jgi:predicted glycosyl hydrolase (DUF1957 family)
MKYLGILLHFYQPFWQEKEILNRIVEECYLPLLDLVLNRKDFKFTFNINYSLIELLEKNNYFFLLEKIEVAFKKRLFELTGTAAYHPILPLIPEEEIIRQIKLNEDGLKRILKKFPKKGFFPPELAFHPNLARILKNLGYLWLIADDLPFVYQYKFAPFNFIPKTYDLAILLRSRLWSQRLAYREFLSPDDFVNSLRIGLESWFKNQDGYLILALDAETFNHHHKNYLNFLERILDKILDLEDFHLAFLSEIFSLFPKKEVFVPAGSWATSADDLSKNILYPLWWHPENKAHQLLWELIDLLLEYIKEADKKTRCLFDKVLNSCQFWWLSGSYFNPPVAFKTFPFYIEIIKNLNLPQRTLNRIKKIFKELCEITNF